MFKTHEDTWKDIFGNKDVWSLYRWETIVQT